MNGGSRIIAIGASENGATDPHDTHVEEERTQTRPSDDGHASASESVETTYSPRARTWTGWVCVITALTLICAWTAAYSWANQSIPVAQLTIPEWVSLITGWTPPVLLICVLWLLFMRSSTRETARFGDAARLLSNESSRLETRLTAVNRELSLAREFLAAESRDLESFGRVTSERLNQNAERLQELVRENGTRVETIGQVSENALENMEKLRGQLPVISSSAKDVTNNIGNAGRTAASQMTEMVSGFNRINDFGQAAEKQIETLRSVVTETLAGFSEQCDQLEKITEARFAELESSVDEFSTRLDTQEVDALAAIRQRAAALSEELSETRNTLEESEESSLRSLRARLSSIRDEGGTISRSLRAGEEQALSGWKESISALEEDRSALFSRIEDADTKAVELARSRLTGITAEAELIERGIAERAEKLITELNERRTSAQAAEREAISQFSEMLGSLDDQIAQIFQIHQRHTSELASQVSTILAQLGSSENDITRIADTARTSGAHISTCLTDISTRLAEAKGKLAETDTQLVGLTDSSVRLLELIKASSDQLSSDLPKSMKITEDALSNTETRTQGISESLREAGKNGQWLANQIDGSGTALKAILADITKMQFQLRDQAISQQDALSTLRKSLKDVEQEGQAISEKALSDLEQAIGTLETSARQSVSIISEQGTSAVMEISEKLRETCSEEIGKALTDSTAEVSGQLEQAASHAADVSREAAVQLRDQLEKVNELVSNLESRVGHAKERAEEQVNNDFARRAALITESLNSNSIDIAKALSTEVADTAWEGYLRGDRGIFTRRAIKLIDNSDAKTIQQVFERDADFRDHVSHYIHDFEGILRQVLSTRDGTALGVTLLSSDMGKLYVALAQAIERLRN